MELKYQAGFGNYFSTESIPGSLPLDQNSPQKVSQSLYPEQISGTAFTAPRSHNLFSWVYRNRPSVVQGQFQKKTDLTKRTFHPYYHIDPNQKRWNALPYPQGPTDFVESIRSLMGSGSVLEQRGFAVHLYACNKNMDSRFFMNADGDFVIIPQEGELIAKTEMGVLHVTPGEILLIPRGIKFQIKVPEGKSRGYIGENFGSPFQLPELGPIGANGLANKRHFLAPVAYCEDLEGSFELYGKFNNELWAAPMNHSPLDVVAWHGNYTPFKYDLAKFNTINTVSFDHPDPSIFTVLTSPSDTAGFANCDFVIFPPRWMVAENTFRPPYFHRNCMSEFMGLIQGVYDAKEGGGFVPGGGSLHNFFSPHGPDVETYKKATDAELKPHKIDNTMAFMFESRYPYQLTDFAYSPEMVQKDYQDCWQAFEKAKS